MNPRLNKLKKLKCKGLARVVNKDVWRFWERTQLLCDYYGQQGWIHGHQDKHNDTCGHQYNDTCGQQYNDTCGHQDSDTCGH